MVDLGELRLKLTMGVLLGMTWTLAFLLPILLGEVGVMPGAEFWWPFGALLAYFLYSGLRAWRKGWRSRFILRVVVPVGLLVVSSILEWVGVWRWLISRNA
jgi:hypothetical protein